MAQSGAASSAKRFQSSEVIIADCWLVSEASWKQDIESLGSP
jgi:hypothetical protein